MITAEEITEWRTAAEAADRGPGKITIPPKAMLRMLDTLEQHLMCPPSNARTLDDVTKNW